MKNKITSDTLAGRIKMVRKSMGLTQLGFGEKIGVKGNTVTNYENGLRTPSDAVILSISRECNVNEKWLRTGEGGDENVFIKLTPQEKAYNRFGYIMENSTPSKKAALTMLLELLYRVPDKEWEIIMNQFEEAKKEG